ncbi:MAG: metallophosphoesterase [Clostridia bacterium]|nr:metallophosphoesterase [Clostridia bacterium]
MLKFKNGKFRIMQVSDPQDLQYIRPTMVRMLNLAYDSLEPDLIVLTGDNILGNHLCDARIGSRLVIKDKAGEAAAMKTAIDKLLVHIDERKIPFAMIYGNHDDRNRLTKEEQADFYRAYSGNIGLDGTDSGDCDTYNVPIYSEDGEKVKFNLWMLDSAWHDKEEDKCYEYVKPQAIEWYRKKSAELKAANGGEPVPSLMFQHIPMIEILELVEECSKDTEGAVPGPDNKYYKLKPQVGGVMGEYPCTVSEKNGQLDAIKECGDVKAVVFGHDHTNCFEGVVDGVNFVQTSCASFRCYGTKSRGVRIFDIDEQTGEYETTFHTYNAICGSSLGDELRYIWDADGMLKQKIALIAGVTAGVGLLTFGAVKGIKGLLKK